MPPTADLLTRARSAVTVEEECDVIDDAMPTLWTGTPFKLDDLHTVVDTVRIGYLPRAVLLGVVAALVPEGWVIRCEPRFYADRERIRWFAHGLRPHWSKWHPDDEEWIDLVSAEANSEFSARLTVALLIANREAGNVEA